MVNGLMDPPSRNGTTELVKRSFFKNATFIFKLNKLLTSVNDDSFYIILPINKC
jgi:hypothetical protein